VPPLGRRCSPALLGLLDIQFGFRFRLRLRFFWHVGPRSKWIEYICPKTCMAGTSPAMTRRKDRYQPRAASASQPKTLKTYACARDCRLESHPRLNYFSRFAVFCAPPPRHLQLRRQSRVKLLKILPAAGNRRRSSYAVKFQAPRRRGNVPMNNTHVTEPIVTRAPEPDWSDWENWLRSHLDIQREVMTEAFGEALGLTCQ